MKKLMLISLIFLIVYPASAFRIPSAAVDRDVAFIAVDSIDFQTRETGLSSFTVYYTLDDAGSATIMTTPTATELSAANMPGVYMLSVDESGMTTLTAGHDTEELVLHITNAAMAPITRVIEIYRPETTEGNTLAVDGSGEVASVGTVTDSTAQSGDAYAIVNHGTYGNDQLVRSTTPANTVNIGADGEVDSDVQEWIGTAVTLDTALPNVTATVLNLAAPLPVDILSISGSITAADNAELDYTVTGFDKSASTIGTATVVTNQVTADVTMLSGDATAADNLELQYDGTTGLSGDTFPANQSQLGNIANTGAAINTIADSATVTFGAETNDYTDTQSLDGTYHIIEPELDTTYKIDIYYEFDIGSTGVPVSTTLSGRLLDPPATTDDITIQAYDWVAVDWSTVGTLDGINSSTDEVKTVILFSTHVGTGANAGTVRVRFVNANISLDTDLYIDLIYCSYSVVSSSVGYAGGSIWVDTNNGTAGTSVGVNGVADLPCLTWADAVTLSGLTGLQRFEIINGSSITLASNSDNYTLYGDEWLLALANQSCNNAAFIGAHVTGIATGDETIFRDCDLAFGGGTLTIAGLEAHNCALAGTITLSAATTHYMDQCYSAMAGTSAPVVDFTAGVGNTNLNMRHYSGGIEVKNIGDTGTDNMSLEGWGQLVLNADCDAGTIAMRGSFTVTDNSGNVTISDDARYDVTQIDDTITANSIVTDIPNTAEFEARTLPSADYVVVGDTLARVTLVDQTTLNDDMVGTDNAALASTLNTKVPNNLNTTVSGNIGIDWANVENPTTSLDLSATDIQLVDTTTTNTDMVGTDGANTTVPDAAGTAAGLHTTTDILIGNRSLATADYFLFGSDPVANVTLVDTTTTNTDMVGTDNGGTLANQTLILEDLEDVKGTGFVKNTNSLIDIWNDTNWILNFSEGDTWTNTATTPWQQEVRLKGTSTSLTKKEYFQVTGSDVTSSSQPIGRITEAP